MSQYQPMYDSFQRSPRDRYVAAPRINVAANVFLPASELDPYTGQLRPDHVRRRRTQAKRLEVEQQEREAQRIRESLERELKKGGVRVTWITAAVLCCTMAFFCLFTIGYQRSTIQALQDQISMTEEQMALDKERYTQLKAELEQACDIGPIATYAVSNLGMIRADAMKAVHLTAVDTRPQAAPVTVYQQTITGAQATQVPMLASAGN